PVSPAPRLIAESMLLLGTEVFFAFWIASTRVGFPARSAPPILAATSMFLMSLANDLARRASIIAFLCLVVAHLEWPDMTAILTGRYCLVQRSSFTRVRRLRFVTTAPVLDVLSFALSLLNALSTPRSLRLCQ